MSLQQHHKPLAAIICGYERGGTTLISEILRQHPQLDSGFEGGLLLADKIMDFIALSPYREMIKDWGIDDQDIDHICQAESWIEVYKRLLTRASRIQQKEIWIFDKTPKYMQVLSSVLAKIPDVPCIVIVRDPCAILWSWAKRFPEGKQHWIDTQLDASCNRYLSYANGWKSAVCSNFAKQILLVRYELLCINQVSEVKRIFDFLELDYNEDYMSFDGRYPNVYGNRISNQYLQEYKANFTPEVCSQILNKTSEFADWFWE